MLVSDFDYHLPEELIAQEPMRPRDHSRLLVLHRDNCQVEHQHFYDLPRYLRSGDLLVFNNTKVFKARMFGKLAATPAVQVEIFLLRPLDTYRWEALARPGKKLALGALVKFGNKLQALVEEKKDLGVVVIKFNLSAKKVLAITDRLGHIPVPPYIHQEPKKLADYQTIYAKNVGSVAAPTAGFHFTPALLSKLKKQGINTAFVTLHVGLGTFQPVKTEKVEEHQMHSEWVKLDAKAVKAIEQTKARGGRVISVGTTATRVLEGVAEKNNGCLAPFSGDLNVFITPGYQFKVIDGMITNFHLPKSTLLMLISSLVGRERILSIYKEAVAKKYHFFSFGDAMLII